MPVNDTIPPGIGEAEAKILTRWLERKAAAGRDNPADDERDLIHLLEVAKDVIKEREKTIRDDAVRSGATVNKVVTSVAVSVIAAGVIGQVIGYGDSKAMSATILALEKRITNLEQNCRISPKP